MCPPPTDRIDADDVEDVESGSEKTHALVTAKLRRTQRLLRRQTARLEATLEAVAHGFAMFDSRDRLITCNLAFLTHYALPVSCARTGTSLQRILDARVTAGTHTGSPEAFVTDHLALARTPHGVNRAEHLATGECLLVSVRPMADGGWVWTQRTAPMPANAEAPVAAAPTAESILPEPTAADLDELPDDAAPLDEAPTPTVVDAIGEDAITPELQDKIDDLMPGFDIGDALEAFGDLADHAEAPADADESEAFPTDDDAALDAAAMAAETALDAALAATLAEVPGGADAIELEALDGLSDGDAVMDAPTEPISLAVSDDPLALALDSLGDTADDLDGEPADPLAAWADDLAAERFELDAAPAEEEMSETLGFAEDTGPSEAAPLFADAATLADELQRGLDAGEFGLLYQPILSMRSQAIVGFEALLRWHHPRHGELPAAQFLPLAESSAHMLPLGLWVLQQALAEAAHWPERYRVAVNLSPAQFRQADLAALLPDLLASHGVSPAQLELEFTESLFVEDGEANLDRLKQLRELGIGLALDDFCAGQSSIRDVLAFAFDRIKVDGDFIRLADASEPAPAVVRAFAELGQWLDIPVTAEGIETAEQLRAVHALGYAEAQGFLIARPLDRDALIGLIGADYRNAAADALADFDLDSLGATA